MEVLAYTLAVLIGISLGLIGSGGSILTVPILVYLLDIDPLLATAYSLFIVGITALVGGFGKAKNGLVDFRMVAVFGIPSIFMVLFTRSFIVPHIPAIMYHDEGFVLSKATFVMILFAVIMLFASISMIRNRTEEELKNDQTFNYKSVFLKGIFLGLVTGMVGAGGGFLIIPTLVISAKMPMKKAIGTSLFIVAFNSLIGFLGFLEIDDHVIDWKLLCIFSLTSIIGIFIGSKIAKKIPGDKLKKSFGYFVLIMGFYIVLKEVFHI
ncbi:sulfite exporter TauE/SafE family protein [Sphingobacterium hungaricum]|uniref:Probable membrane transporter protein n=1 Tax=Sphingobacterium hungaricum TaxID=2082723 RepID=A0A928YPZ0_9SPHI|nr:sulfite exporter TauE/SafE family protein [Sphingobacterium hungaricum]MBE8713399.1 permease [Sphingobacterium hungaricum]